MPCASLAAYSFSRFRVRGRKFLFFLILSTQFIPAVVIVLPFFLLEVLAEVRLDLPEHGIDLRQADPQRGLGGGHLGGESSTGRLARPRWRSLGRCYAAWRKDLRDQSSHRSVDLLPGDRSRHRRG